MIKVENITIDSQILKRTFSDSNKKIRKVGTDDVYEEAVDLLNAQYIYEETDEEIIPVPQIL